MLTTPVTAIVPFLLKVEGSLWYHCVMLRYRHNTVAFPSKVTEVQMQSSATLLIVYKVTPG